MRDLTFHIRSNDYFGTLATILDLLRQRLVERGFVESDALALKQCTKDLLHLQAKYIITKRAEVG